MDLSPIGIISSLKNPMLSKIASDAILPIWTTHPWKQEITVIRHKSVITASWVASRFLEHKVYYIATLWK